MLILPFTNVLNVKAETVEITTDDTKTLEGNTAFKYVTNTTKLVEYGISEDTLDAYKVLDVYYNESTNEMSYGFTQNFQTFLNQLDSSDEFANYTVEKYQQLTSDDLSNYGNIVTTSTLNKLVSKYATYIKKNNITGLSVTEIENIYVIENIEVGSYLLLPAKITIYNNMFMPTDLVTGTYGVTVVNIMFTVNYEGAWELDNEVYVNSKFSINMLGSVFSKEIDGNTGYNDITYVLGDKLYYAIATYGLKDGIPTNTHSSILNNASIMKSLTSMEIIFPTGVTYNTSNMIYFSTTMDDEYNIKSATHELEIKNNALYYTSDGTEYKYADIEFSEDSSKMTLSNIDRTLLTGTQPNKIYIEININDNIKVGTSASNIDSSSNTIIAKSTFLKDAYTDIGTNPTQEDINKVIESVSIANTIYTYGVTVTNKGNNEILNGSRFQICTDKACTNKVGNEFEITENGTYTFKGINDTDTYYLKQVKAPTGYKLLSEPVELNPTSLNKEAGLYSIEVNNNKQGLLPSTGGLGTIFYTLIGLLVIGTGAYSIIKYSKKQINS